MSFVLHKQNNGFYFVAYLLPKQITHLHSREAQTLPTLALLHKLLTNDHGCLACRTNRHNVKQNRLFNPS